MRNLLHRMLAAEVAKRDGSIAGLSWDRTHCQETYMLLLPERSSVCCKVEIEIKDESDSLGNVPLPPNRQTQRPDWKPQQQLVPDTP